MIKQTFCISVIQAAESTEESVGQTPVAAAEAGNTEKSDDSSSSSGDDDSEYEEFVRRRRYARYKQYVYSNVSKVLIVCYVLVYQI